MTKTPSDRVKRELKNPEAVAGNGLLHRRVFLRGGAALAGAMTGYTLVPSASGQQLADDAWSLAPGLTVHKIGGHTKGLQCVRVATERGPVVLASDATHFYAHIDSRRVFRVLYNQGDMLEGYNTLERLAGARERVIPGHDPLVLERYPAASASTSGWAVRVDLPPGA